MFIEDIRVISLIEKAVNTIEALKDAIENKYWIKISTPYWEGGEICGGELPHIFDKHLKAAIEEMEQYIEGIEIKGL